MGLELSVVRREADLAADAAAAVRAARDHGTPDRKVIDGHGHPGDPDLVLHFAVCHRLGFTPFPEVPDRW